MKWKIALLSDHASPLATIGSVDAGGQNIAVAGLAQQLAGFGYTVDIFTRHEQAELPEIVSWQPGIRVIHIKAGPVRYIEKEKLLPHMDEFTRNMICFISREPEPYQLIHAHFFMSGLVASTLKQQFNIPFVITFHALGEVRKRIQGCADRFPAERTLIEHYVIDQADRVIALCPQDRDDLITMYSASPDKITVIPNGFDTDHFFPVSRELARHRLALAAEEPVILQLGRLVPRKGIDNVIRALGSLKRRYELTARLLIVGGDSVLPDPELTPEIGRLQEIALAESVENQVTFTGSRKREELRYFYSAADVFVTTPWYEPFGITPLEAMACGTPVIGSAVGGIKTTVLDNETGFLIPPNDPDALAAKLAAVLTNKTLRRFLSDESVRHVNSLYTWKQVAQQTIACYGQLMHGQKQTGLHRKRTLLPYSKQLTTGFMNGFTL